MPTEQEAVALLEDLGLTENEARCFVALSRVGQSTAKEISDLSGVSRSRVYDAVDRLHRRGLVDIQQSEPREFAVVGKDHALETLREDYRTTISDLDSALEELESVEAVETEGAWAIADHDNVTDRITRLVGEASSEVYLVAADEDVVEPTVREHVAEAGERGADVIVEASTGSLADRFREAVPDAHVAVSEVAGSRSVLEGKWLSRILMIDREAVVMAAATEGLGSRTEETAIWAKGADHGLVVGIRELLADRIHGLEGDEA